MKINLDKCAVLHFVPLNQGRTYTLNGLALESAVEHREYKRHIYTGP